MNVVDRFTDEETSLIGEHYFPIIILLPLPGMGQREVNEREEVETNGWSANSFVRSPGGMSAAASQSSRLMSNFVVGSTRVNGPCV
jgi:hypothetical protein